MAIYSCKDCVAPKRYPGCHAVCPEYLAEKEQHDKEKEIIAKKKYIYDGLNAQAVSSIYRAQKIAKKLKGNLT